MKSTRARMMAVLTVVAALLLQLTGSLAFAAEDDQTETTTALNEGPLVIVFDLSGSMNEEDSSGTNKLSTATTAMSDLLRNQPPHTEVALWTYPGGQSDSDGCYAGGWIQGLSPSDHPDPTDVDKYIRSTTADGETPTGPALQGVVDSLIADGYDSATILLVSDGEANCGRDACEVASEIVDSGFNVAIPTVGFDIAESGQSQLQCIADVTGAQYSDAADSQALLDEIAQYQGKPLEVNVTVPDQIKSGGNAEFDVVVTNPSNETMTGLSAVLVMDEGESRTIFPQVLAPQKRLPALAPGESMTLGWTVTAATGEVGDASWRVAVGAQGIGSVLEKGSIAVTDSVASLADGGELIADLPGPIVVMGDSYSSGEGAGEYIDASDSCHRSYQSYGGVLGGDSTEIIACSGATSASFTQWQNGSVDPQLAQLGGLDEAPGAVFLTLGGNDIGFADIMTRCFTSDCTKTEGYTDRVLGYAGNVGWQLKKVYREVVAEANTAARIEERDGEIAPVIVSPYPDLLWSPSQGSCSSLATPLGDALDDYVWRLDSQEIAFGRSLVLTLNNAIRKAVADLQAEGLPVYFADDVVDFAQPNQTVCNDDSYFVSMADAVDRTLADKIANATLSPSKYVSHEMAHPNADGYEAWAETVLYWSHSADAEPLTKPVVASNSGGRLMTLATTAVLARNHTLDAQLQPIDDDGAAPASEGSGMRARGGDSVTITLKDLDPGSTVMIAVFSSMQTVGSATVDDNGTVTTTVTLPANLPAGQHTLTLDGWDADGNAVALDYPLTIGSAIPLWLAVVAGLGVVFLISAGVFVTIAIRRSKRG